MGIGNIATSGMDAAMSDMEVISNNIANVNTVGFKKSYADFADIYPSTAGINPGLGVALSDIRQDFSEGGIQSSDRNLDMSIGNSGFFVMRDAVSGQTSYTRAGRFFQNSAGFVGTGNMRLQMFPAVNGQIQQSAQLQDVLIPTATFPPSMTANSTININLNSSATPPTVPFAPGNASSYNYSTQQTVYDSLGNPYQLSVYYIKSGSAANTWTAQVQVNGTGIGVGTMTFDQSGNLLTTAGMTGLTFTPIAGATTPQTVNLAMTGTTQVSGTSINRDLAQDGYAAGVPTGYQIDANGDITMSFSNNKTTLLGQIALATFAAPEQLQYQGSQSWIATTTSGTASISPSNSANAITSNSLESSNVNLTQEMVNLLDAQHNFQANAQVESTYSEVMQTIIKL